MAPRGHASVLLFLFLSLLLLLSVMLLLLLILLLLLDVVVDAAAAAVAAAAVVACVYLPVVLLGRQGSAKKYQSTTYVHTCCCSCDNRKSLREFNAVATWLPRNRTSWPMRTWPAVQSRTLIATRGGARSGRGGMPPLEEAPPGGAGP